jgi:hypothetical protein
VISNDSERSIHKQSAPCKCIDFSRWYERTIGDGSSQWLLFINLACGFWDAQPYNKENPG